MERLQKIILFCSVVVSVATAQTGVCTRSQAVSVITSYSTLYSYYYSYSCGSWWGWSTCYSTSYYYRLQYRYTTTYILSQECCSGYQDEAGGLDCEPICNCDSNHICTAPYTCVCPVGWTGDDCMEDIDECAVGTSGCEQVCTNTDGSYSCSCNEEYALESDLHSCRVNCTYGRLRLAGSSVQQGTLEVCVSSNWGTVCDNGWSTVDANIACRQLGYSNADAVARYNAYFGQSSGSIYLTNVGCTGSESRLIDCSYSSSTSGCSHSDDAGVECRPRCTHVDVRIVGGSNNREGRVEVCLNGIWGTVCDDYWSQEDANIVCRQLGYSNSDATAFHSAYFGQGILPILLDNVMCLGSESRLLDCSYDSNTGDCSHSDDAGVSCLTACTHGDARLRGNSSSSNQGRVEVCVSGVWGTVCDDSWAQVDANIVCRQLGYSNSDSTAFNDAYFGEGILPILLDDVSCLGSESQLLACSYDSNTADCSHSDDAGVSCQTACTHGSVRLRGSSSDSQGRVEVCVNSIWGTVCDDSWSVDDAKVACRKVGYPLPNPAVYTNAAFGQGNLPILLDEVSCNGSESTLTSCAYDSNTEDCIHADDAGVKCQYVPTTISVGTALTSSVGYESINYYQYNFPSNGITISLNVGTGTINCYASDRYQNPNEELYDWKIVVSGYSDIFIDPNLLDRTPGLYVYVALQGVGTTNTFTLDSTTGDTRAPQALTPNTGVSDSLGANERTYYEFVFDTDGVTLRLSVTTGTLICYASDLIQNPNEEQGYVWKVTTTGYIDVFLDPDALMRTAGSTLYVGLEGVDTSNIFSLNSTTGDRRIPKNYNVSEEIVGSVESNELTYFKLEFPSDGVTFTLTVTTGSITCYASDTVQNPNEEQSYEWKVETNNYAEVFLDPDSLNREPGTYVYIGLEGGSSVNNFSLNSTSGDRRTPAVIATNATSTDTVEEGNRIYYQFPFPSDGVTIVLNVSSGYVICYASDRYQNPNEAQGYDWRIEVTGYADIYLNPSYLSRSAGSTIYVAIEGVNVSNHITLGNNEGDRRVPSILNAGEATSSSVDQGRRLFFQFAFPSNGLTIRLSTLSGRVVCFASDRLTNPTGTQGYDWRIETDDYTDVFIDPILLNRDPGEYIYISIEGLHATNSFSLNTTLGDHRVPFDASIGSTVTFSLVYQEVVYYKFSFPNTGLTFILDIPYGSVVCYASDTIQNPNPENGYSWRVEASYYNDSYIDPSVAVGGYIYVGIEGRSNASNNTFNLNSTVGDTATKVPDPPSGVQSLSITSTSASITWEAPVALINTPISDIEHYELMVYEYVHNLPTIFANTTELTYTFTGLEEFVNYTCKVLAFNRVGRGQYSTAFNFSTQQAASSGPPQNVTGIAVSATLISLEWLMPAAIDVNGIITKYVVNVEEVYTGQAHNLFTENMHINIGPLHPYYIYKCSVAAYTIATGVFSSPFNVTTLETSPTGPPLNLSDDEIGPRSVLLSWQPPQFELQNGRIRQYLIRVTLNKTGLTYSVVSTSNQHLLQNLFPFHTYLFEVAAQTIGLGPYSPQLVVTLLQDAPDAAPENVTGYAINATSIFLGWKPPPNDTHNGVIRGYQINCTEENTGMLISVMSELNETIISNLHPAYIYSCKVSAVTVETGVFSGNITLQTEESVPTGPPQNISPEIISSRSIWLTWEPPLLEERNGEITGYTVAVTNVDTGESFELLTSETTLNVDSLRPYMNYNLTVAASTDIGQGPSALEVSITTPEDVPSEPLSPNTAQITDSPTELLVSWDYPSEPNGIITSYRVYCYETYDSSGEGETDDSIDVNVTTTVVAGNVIEAVVTDLTPYTFYDCYVTANTSVGEGTASDTDSARTDESVPASPPESISARETSANSIEVMWSDPTIPYGVITSYSVRYNISDGNLTSFTTESQHVTLEGLDEYTVYAISVSASTRIGFGPYAQVLERTGQAKPHSSPTSIQIPSTDERAVTISWQPPILEDRNGIITFYVISIHNLQFNVDDIIVNVSGSDESYTVSGLEEYCRYECQIAAGTVIGMGPYSSYFEFFTMQDAPSSPPLNVIGSTQSSTIIYLSWDPPPAIDINGVIQYYSIRVLESETRRSWSFVHVEPEISVGSLHPYYNYECKVAAYTVGLGPYTNTTLVQTDEEVPTSAPLGLRVVAIESHSLLLAWEEVPLEHRNGRVRHYEVKLKEIESGNVLQLTSISTQVNVSNLHPFYNYNCSVAAETIDLGPFSENIRVQTDEYTPSDAPLDVTGQVVDSTTVSLSWSPPLPENQNGVIRKYIIAATETDTGNVYTWESISTNIGIHSLHPFYTYQFTVAAYTIERGPFSYIVTLQTPEDVPSAAPQNVVIESVLSKSFRINWQPPDNEHQNGIITEYSINIVNFESENITHLDVTDTDITVSNLQPFTQYEVTVAAHTSAGRGPFSAIQIVQTQESAPSTSPGDLQVTVVSSTALHLSWTAPQEERNGIIREYRVKVNEVETSQIQMYSTTNLFITVQSLHPFYTYRCAASAFTVATGPFTNFSMVMLPENVPSGYPQNFLILPTTSRSVDLQWDPPLIADQNGIITVYTIMQTVVATGDSIEYVTNNTNMTLTDLTPHTTYAWAIAASTSVGRGPYSTTVNVIMPEDAPTEAPQILSGFSTTSQSIYLAWTPPDTLSQNGIIRQYYVNVTDLQTGGVQLYTSRSPEIEITNLHPYYSYEVRVSAYTVALGPFSEHLTIRTLENVPSGPPLDIVAEVNSSREILLQWNPPLLEEQNGIVIGYKVTIAPIIGGERFNYETTDQFLSVVGLAPYTTYEIVIAAMTSIGTGPFSEIVTVQTSEEAPGQLSNSSGVAINATHIHLMWDPPPLNETNGDIEEYRITVHIIEDDIVLSIVYNSTEGTELVAGPVHPYYTYNISIQAVTIEPGPPIVIIVRTPEAAPSSPPASINVSVINATAIFLSWEPPPQENQNGIIRQYIIELHTAELEDNITITSIETNATITNLHPYTLYEFTVAAETILVGPSSPVQLARTHQAAPSAAPEDILVSVVSSTTVQIEWHPPGVEDRNGIIREYIINITEINTGNTWHQTIENDTDTFITLLHPFYSYSFSIAAQTIALGPFTTSIIVEMPEDAPSSPPTEVAIDEVTTDGLTLSWNYPPEEDRNGQIRHFIVNITEVNTGMQYRQTTTTNTIEINFLHPFYTYLCSVAAVTVSAGPYSTPISVITLSAAPTGLPQNIHALEINESSLTLVWDPPLASEQNGLITNYVLNMTTEEGNMLYFETNSNTFTFSNLDPYGVYYFAITAETVAGQGPFSIPMPFLTGEAGPTAPPNSLTITSIGSSYAEVRWNAPDSSEHNGIIRSYKVFIREEETGRNFTLSSTNTRIIITDLHPFYNYNVTIAAVTISPGPYSQHLWFTTLQDVPSAFPREVGGEALNSSSVLLTWQPPSDNQLNGILTGYVVNVTETETGNQYQILTDDVRYTFVGLHPFYRYTFIVAALTVGQGPFSEIFPLQMPQDAPSAPPTSVEGNVFNSSALSISWRPPSLNNQNGIIIGYVIHLLEIVTGNLRIINTDGPHTEAFITSLHPYYTYEFAVAAQTVDVGPFSLSSTAQTDEDAPSAAPDNVTATPLDSVTIELVWKPPPLDAHNGIIRQYSIDYYVSETRESVYKLLIDNSTSTVLTDLHPYYTYSFNVAAATIAAGPQSTAVVTRTLESAPSGAPQSVEAVAVSSTSIRLTWNPPLAENQNGLIRSYHINVSAVEDGGMMYFETDGFSTIFILNSLHPYYLYNIRIAAFTVGMGPYTTVEERTHSEVPTGAPKDLTVVALNSSTVQVSWDPPQPDKQNGPIDGYLLKISGINSNQELELNIPRDPNILTVPGLHPFYTYTYTIAAIGVGIGPYSSAVSFQMPEEVCRASVRDVLVEIETATSVTVSWLPPDVQFWNGVITSYTVIYELIGRVDGNDAENDPLSSQTISIPQTMLNNKPDPRIATLPLKRENVVIEMLEEFYVYQFSAFLENAVGQSDISTSITVEMPPAAPSGPPTNVTAIALSSTSILITWNNPKEFDSNGILTGVLIVLTDARGDSKNFTLPASTFSLHLESLKKFHVYAIEVLAENKQGKGPLSESVSVRTLEDLPSSPLDASVELINSTAVTLKWSPPDSPNGNLLYYTITFYGYKADSKEIVDATTLVVVNSHETTAVLTGLQPGLTYSFEIRANTSEGFSEGVTVTYKLADRVDVSETGNDERITQAIAAISAVAGVAVIILVVMVAIYIWRRIMGSKALKLFNREVHVNNSGAQAEHEEDLHLTSFKDSSSKDEQEDSSDHSKECDDSVLKEDTEM